MRKLEKNKIKDNSPKVKRWKSEYRKTRQRSNSEWTVNILPLKRTFRHEKVRKKEKKEENKRQFSSSEKKDERMNREKRKEKRIIVSNEYITLYENLKEWES